MKPGEQLTLMRGMLTQSALENNISELRLFGSVARREDTEKSDVNLLAMFCKGATLFDLCHFKETAVSLFRCDVDILTDEALVFPWYSDLYENSLTIGEFFDGKKLGDGEWSGKFESLAVERLAQIADRVGEMVAGKTFLEFSSDTVLQDAVAYNLQRFADIVRSNSPEVQEMLQRKYEWGISWFSKLTDMPLGETCPRLVYNTSVVLARKDIVEKGRKCTEEKMIFKKA